MSAWTSDTFAEAKGNLVDGVDIDDGSGDRIGMRSRTLLSVMTKMDEKTGFLETETFKKATVPSLRKV